MIIFKHTHYGFPFMFQPLFSFKDELEKKMTVCFTESCKYELEGEDQHDINKLFGFGYGYHHTDSDRFGWRWNPEKEKIELVTYSYVSGKRISSEHIAWVDIDEEVELGLWVHTENNIYQRWVVFSIIQNGKKSVTPRGYATKRPWFKYSLGLYFGGNRRAPQTIKIKKK